MTITWKQFERYWFLFSLGVIIASVPFSKFFISFGQFMIIGGWIEERLDYNRLTATLRPMSSTGRVLRFLPEAIKLLFTGIYNGFKDFFRQKPALLFASVFLLHIVGLIFTTNFDYALKDLRIKFPLLLIPLVLSTSRELSGKEFRNYLLLIILASLIRSVFQHLAYCYPSVYRHQGCFPQCEPYHFQPDAGALPAHPFLHAVFRSLQIALEKNHDPDPDLLVQCIPGDIKFIYWNISYCSLPSVSLSLVYSQDRKPFDPVCNHGNCCCFVAPHGCFFA